MRASRVRAVGCAFLVAACGVEVDTATDDGVAEGARSLNAMTASIAEGSTDAVGLMAFVNDPKTTLTLLDITCKLDKRAATGILAHRDGADGKAGTPDDDRFDTVAELDAVAYVGTAALDSLLSYARAHGWVTGDSTTLGTFDTVLFTVDEGLKTLSLANTATVAHLDESVGLDSRAAANIVKARPLASIAALAKVSYVGASALKALKLAAGAPSGAAVADHLATASAGLWHTSESDYPFVVVRIAEGGAAALSAGNIKALLAGTYQNRPNELPLAQRDVEMVSLGAFFDRYVVPEDWWEDDQKAQAGAFAALEAVFQSQLLDVHVFRIGQRRGPYLSGAIDVFIVGRSKDGELVGVSTVSVET